jgi:hypothetical protein
VKPKRMNTQTCGFATTVWMLQDASSGCCPQAKHSLQSVKEYGTCAHAFASSTLFHSQLEGGSAVAPLNLPHQQAYIKCTCIYLYSFTTVR